MAYVSSIQTSKSFIKGALILWMTFYELVQWTHIKIKTRVDLWYWLLFLYSIICLFVSLLLAGQSQLYKWLGHMMMMLMLQGLQQW